MMEKRMIFHGVEYLVIPVELWEEVKDTIADFQLLAFTQQLTERFEQCQGLRENMLAYEGSNEPTELTDE
jgi:hypothetical protein